MNFIFDNCLSFRLAGAIRALADVEGDQVVHLKERFAANVTDVEWISEIGKEGGWVVISGDSRILKNPHERKVWQQSRLIGFFLAPAWLKMKFWDQSWHFVRVWPNLRKQADLAEAGSTFEVPIKSGKFRAMARLP